MVSYLHTLGMKSNVDDSLTFEYADVNGIRVHYARSGEGPLMVFLHGFPQCWYEFRHQLREFSQDHLAVSADLRGYNLTSKPRDLRESGVLWAVEDLRQLVVDHFGMEKFVLVGHDWGGAVGWSFALQHPELLERLVILSTAHPALLEREMRHNPEQQEASQYMLALRPLGGEDLFAANDYAVLRGQFEQLDFMSPDDVEAYHQAWSQPGALTGMFSYYRREGIGPETDAGTPAHGNYAREAFSQIVEVPTLVLYTDGDIYTRPGCHRGLEQYVRNLRFKVLQGGSHWIAEEFPEWVNDEVRGFLSAESDVEQAAERR
jgi:epoxide hydrolase 4